MALDLDTEIGVGYFQINHIASTPVHIAPTAKHRATAQLLSNCKIKHISIVNFSIIFLLHKHHVITIKQDLHYERGLFPHNKWNCML